MILVDEVEVPVNRGFKYYEKLGYVIPKYKDDHGRVKIKRGTVITVKVKDLPAGSAVRVKIKCEDCNYVRTTQFQKLTRPTCSYLKDGTTLCLSCTKKRAKGVLNCNFIHGSRGYSQYMSGAKKRGLSFDLTLRQYVKITSKKCHYCGGTSFSKWNSSLVGIDRKNPSVGYSMKNCVPCCKTCNFAKGDMSYEEFKSWIKKVNIHFLKR